MNHALLSGTYQASANKVTFACSCLKIAGPAEPGCQEDPFLHDLSSGSKCTLAFEYNGEINSFGSLSALPGTHLPQSTTGAQPNSAWSNDRKRCA